MKPWEGHRFGIEKLRDVLNWCLEYNIRQVSIWVLSTENLKRSKEELDAIFRLLWEYMKKWEEEKSPFYELVRKYEVQVRFFGDFRKLPPEIVRLMRTIMRKTRKYHKTMLNFLVCYGGKFELTQAVKKLIKKAKESGRIRITEKTIEKHLLIQSNVDLIIRTGGMSRLSNFLLWQSAYSEIYVTETLWPAFTKNEFVKALEWFSSVQRNFGR